MPTLVILVLLLISAAMAQREITFYTVAIDPETRTADKKLKEYLELYKPGEEPSLSLSNPANYKYEDVIRLLAQDKGRYLARTTPYVYVVAEMLGAKMEVLATYWSKATERTTYHSYFVVNQHEFDNFGPENRSLEPTLDDLVIYLKEKGQASQRQVATFIYHNKFSTSSFFVPSLFFRERRIYSMKE